MLGSRKNGRLLSCGAGGVGGFKSISPSAATASSAALNTVHPFPCAARNDVVVLSIVRLEEAIAPVRAGVL